MLSVGFGLLSWQELQSLWWLRAEHQLDGVAPSFFLSPKSQRHAVNNRAASLAEMVNVQNNSAIRTYIDKDGVLQTAPANTPRIDWSFGYPRLLLEGAATNFAENSGNNGAVVGVIGAGGALPSNFTVNTSTAGLMFEVTAKGSTGGVPWTEIRISGTNNSGGNAYPDPSPNNRPAAAVGETWSYSFYASLVAGALPASSGAGKLSVAEYSAANSYISASDNNIKISTWKRYSHSRTFTNATVAKSRGFLSLQILPGETVDFTFRIGGLQLEKSPAPTSLIHTTGTVLTRTADLATLHSSARVMTAWAWRGYVPSLMADQRLLNGVDGAILRSSSVTPPNLFFDGTSGNSVQVAANAIPGEIGFCGGWGPTARRASNNGSVAVESSQVTDRDRTTMYIGKNSGLQAGQVIYLDELVGWVLPDRPSAAGVQLQARAAA